MNAKWFWQRLLRGGALAAALIAAGIGAASASGIPSVLPTLTFRDPDGTVGDWFGISVALSADGSEALIGSSGATLDGLKSAGKAYLYTQSNGVWPAMPTVTFLDPTLKDADEFGSVVQLSADGSVAAIASGSSAGSDNFVYIYEQSNGVWSTTPVITLTDPNPSERGPFGDNFGGCLSLSADGNSLLVGAANANVNGVTGPGTAYIFTRTAGVWSDTPAVTFSDPGAIRADTFGCGALNADGTVAIITTAPFGIARAFVFVQTSGVWNTTPVATYTVGEAGDITNVLAALSGAGDLALLGVGDANANAGAAYFYVPMNGDWPAMPTVTLSDPAPAPANVYFGSQAVALSGDGTVALIDGNTTDADTAWGTVYLYTGTGTAWADAPAAILADPQPFPLQGATCCDFGYSVALSQNGNTVIVGSPDAPIPAVGLTGGAGWAYIYDEPSAGWASPTPTPSPTTTTPPASGGGESGGGALSLFGLLALVGLAALRKLNVWADPREF